MTIDRTFLSLMYFVTLWNQMCGGLLEQAHPLPTDLSLPPFMGLHHLCVRWDQRLQNIKSHLKFPRQNRTSSFHEVDTRDTPQTSANGRYSNILWFTALGSASIGFTYTNSVPNENFTAFYVSTVGVQLNSCSVLKSLLKLPLRLC